MKREIEPPGLAAIEAMDKAIATRKQEAEAAGSRLAALQAELADEESDASVGAPGAAERAADLRNQVAAQQQATERCRNAVQTAEAHRAAAARKHAEAEALERRRSVPRLTAEYLRLALHVEQVAAQLGAGMNDLADTGRALGEAIGSTEARRVFGLGATAEMLMHCLLNCFNKRDDAPEALRQLRGSSTPFRWLPYDHNQASPLCKTRLSVAAQAAVDNVVTIYATEEAAVAARARLDPAGLTIHAVWHPLEHLWRLVRWPLRGAASRRATTENAA